MRNSKKSDFETSRRQFLNYATGLAVSTAGMSNLAFSSEKKLSPNDPTAVALQYVEEASQAARVAKMGITADKQFCYNCALYQGLKTDELAPCIIFQNKIVVGGGWCAAWVPKSS